MTSLVGMIPERLRPRTEQIMRKLDEPPYRSMDGRDAMKRILSDMAKRSAEMRKRRREVRKDQDAALRRGLEMQLERSPKLREDKMERKEVREDYMRVLRNRIKQDMYRSDFRHIHGS